MPIKLPRKGPSGRIYPATRPSGKSDETILAEVERVLHEAKELLARLERGE